MLRLHKEGRKIILNTLLILGAINLAVHYFIGIEWLEIALILLSLVLYGLVLQFFRNPIRHTHINDKQIIAPADGKVVSIEEIDEDEFFKDKRIQISVFMSPLNVHVNRYPVSGTVKYAKYHPGAYLVAWHPKSSTLNERTSVVVTTDNGEDVMYKQIAGAVARRIVMYAKEGMKVLQGKDSGFIKFGSRVDIILPLDANILVKIGDKPKGGETAIAELK